MAVIPMQKVAIIAHKSVQKTLVDRLYEEGVLQITTQSSAESNIEPTEKITFTQADVTYALEELSSYASKATKQNIQRISTKPDAVQHTVEHTDTLGIIKTLRDLEEADTAIYKQNSELQTTIQSLQLWTEYPFAVQQNGNTSHFVVIQTGTVAKAQTEAFVAAIEQLQLVELYPTGSNATHNAFACLVAKSISTEFEQVATTHGFTRVQLPTGVSNPKAALEQARVQLLANEQKLEANKKERSKLSIELPKLYQVAVYLRWLADRSKAHKAFSTTEETVTLFGWMPKKQVPVLEAKLHKTIGSIALLSIEPDQDETPPVALKNPKWLSPFESVTSLYGLPLHNEMDPTVVLSPFFIVFFALCLTDAGYGAVLALIFGTYVLKNKLKPARAQLPWLLFLSGMVTFAVGILFGGWFGLTPEQVPSFLSKQTADGLLFKGQIWNLSKQSGIEFLQNLSLILGLVHLFFGMFLAGYYKWVHGAKAAAFWQDFTSHILLVAILLLAFGGPATASWSMYALYGALALMIWGKGYGSPWYVRPLSGLLGMINFGIGMLSNSLSYLRLLALGLVTGAIALAINQVAVEVGNLLPVFLKIPVILIIFSVGHLVSIALNTLGSFIHSGRLQFIEFFSQFFEGGGQGFSPFRRNS